MIHVECTYLNPANLMPTANLYQVFKSVDEYKKFYSLAKTDPFVVLNIMRYNPQENSSLKHVRDAILLNCPRSNPL